MVTEPRTVTQCLHTDAMNILSKRNAVRDVLMRGIQHMKVNLPVVLVARLLAHLTLRFIG